MQSRRLFGAALVAAMALAAVFLLAACGSGKAAQQQSPTAFVPLATATPSARATAPAATEEATQPPTTQPTAAPTIAPQQDTNEQQGGGQTTENSGPPDSGNWIDVNVSNYTVSLMSGSSAIQVIGPVAVGEQIDTGAYLSTQTGLFHVYSMNPALTYDAPYDTYISDWVGFDPSLDNGFHSFLKDKDGNVVDASTGNVSNGCIRTPNPQAIYNFASIGMPVYVHR
jgi:lipoprotein-anchoring transpeptidase ErfK/SrfK